MDDAAHGTALLVRHATVVTGSNCKFGVWHYRMYWWGWGGGGMGVGGLQDSGGMRQHKTVRAAEQKDVLIRYLQA